MGISMTACDLCAMYKPWQTQLDLVYVIMEEFWQQVSHACLGNRYAMPWQQWQQISLLENRHHARCKHWQQISLLE